jgi:hypothetical protein
VALVLVLLLLRCRLRASRHMLHAWRLGFHQPKTREWMEFTSPIPEDFKALGVKIDKPVIG